MRTLTCVLLSCVFTWCSAAVFNRPNGGGPGGVCVAGARCAPLNQCLAPAQGTSADELRGRSCGGPAHELRVCCWENPARADLSPPVQRHVRSPAVTPPPSPSPPTSPSPTPPAITSTTKVVKTSGTRPLPKLTPKPTGTPVSKPPTQTSKPNGTTKPPTPTQTRPPGRGKPGKQSPSARACEEFRRQKNRFGSTMRLNRRDANRVNVVGGERAINREFLYMVAIGYVRGNNNANTSEIQWGCGGSLISDRYVLTAAHCITDAQRENMRPVVLRTGTNHIIPGPRHGGDYSVESITLHPKHDPDLKYFDLALLRTDRPVPFTEGQLPVCLATPQTRVHANTTLLVAGWGAVDPAGFEPSADLKKALLRIVNLEECKQFITNSTSLPRGLDSSMMCAAEPNRLADTCRGDSGGPLAARGPQGDVLVGVTSFGGRPCAGSRPGVYARVQPELRWIESVVWK